MSQLVSTRAFSIEIEGVRQEVPPQAVVRGATPDQVESLIAAGWVQQVDEVPTAEPEEPEAPADSQEPAPEEPAPEEPAADPPKSTKRK